MGSPREAGAVRHVVCDWNRALYTDAEALIDVLRAAVGTGFGAGDRR